MAKLTKAAIALLQAAGCNEVGEDYVVIGTTDLRILLSHKAIEDLNLQAREENELDR